MEKTSDWSSGWLSGRLRRSQIGNMVGLSVGVDIGKTKWAGGGNNVILEVGSTGIWHEFNVMDIGGYSVGGDRFGVTSNQYNKLKGRKKTDDEWVGYTKIRSIEWRNFGFEFKAWLIFTGRGRKKW